MTTLNRSRLLGAAALLFAPLVGGCDDGATQPDIDDGAQAQVSVYLTDAPGGVDSVWVQVDDVVLMGDDTRHSLLAEPTGLLNLTALRDSTAALALNQVADTGAYNQVRFVLGGAVLQTEEGKVYVTAGMEHPHGLPADGDLICPSCDQSGIKVKFAAPVEMESGDNGLLLDFDVGQSFGHAAGHSDKWVMHPVIHGAHGEPDEMENEEVGGEIHGMVMPAIDENGDTLRLPACGGEDRDLSAFIPTAISLVITDDEGSPLEFAGETEAEDDGFEFEIEVTSAGAYTLGYKSETALDGATLTWTADVEPLQVSVMDEGEGEDDVDGVLYTITSVACTASSGS